MAQQSPGADPETPVSPLHVAALILLLLFIVAATVAGALVAAFAGWAAFAGACLVTALVLGLLT